MVSVAEWVGCDSTWVSVGETSVSKPSMNCRNSIVESKTGIGDHPGISAGGVLKPGPHALRLEGGVTPTQAFARNVGTCRPDVKVMIQVGLPGKDQTDAGHRGRVVRSRVEGAVMVLDRRGDDIQPDLWTNR